MKSGAGAPLMRDASEECVLGGFLRLDNPFAEHIKFGIENLRGGSVQEITDASARAFGKVDRRLEIGKKPFDFRVIENNGVGLVPGKSPDE